MKHAVEAVADLVATHQAALLSFGDVLQTINGSIDALTRLAKEQDEMIMKQGRSIVQLKEQLDRVYQHNQMMPPPSLN